MKKSLLIAYSFFISTISFSQDIKFPFPKYNLIVENGIGINFSTIEHDKNLTQAINPSIRYQKGYFYSIGIEKIVKNNVYTLKIKRVYVGNLLNFYPTDSLNRILPLYVGVARPTFILNASYGKRFKLDKLNVGFKIGFDYFLFYRVDSYIEFSYVDTQRKDLPSVIRSSRSINGLFLTPNAELNLSLPIKIKKVERFTVGYNLTFNYGLKKMQETTYEISHKGNYYLIKNSNKGTYLTNAIVISIPLTSMSRGIAKK